MYQHSVSCTLYYYIYVSIFITFYCILTRYREKVLQNSWKTTQRVPEFNKIATLPSRAATSWRPIAKSRVYENSDSLLAFSAFFSHWDRKSVQPICHALRKRTHDCRIVIVILLSLLWIICRNLIMILFNLTYNKLYSYYHIYEFIYIFLIYVRMIVNENNYFPFLNYTIHV